MNQIETELDELFARQHDLATRDQLRQHGWNDRRIDWAVTSHRLVGVRHGVLGLVRFSPSEYGRIMAAVLAAGPQSGASHLAGAWLWGAECVAKGPLVVTSFRRRARQLQGVETHSSRLDPKKSLLTSHDVPTVAPALVVVQLAPHWKPPLVERIADDLVKKNVTSFPAILTWIDAVRTPGLASLREFCLRNVKVAGHDDSPPARQLGLAMLEAGIEPFTTQYEVVTPEGIVRLDFAWPRLRVAVEFNGWRDHGSRRGFDRDAKRTCALMALGWRVLPVTSAMATNDVINWVSRALQASQAALVG